MDVQNVLKCGGNWLGIGRPNWNDSDSSYGPLGHIVGLEPKPFQSYFTTLISETPDFCNDSYEASRSIKAL